jgi:PAS domain S-box-containing protein
MAMKFSTRLSLLITTVFLVSFCLMAYLGYSTTTNMLEQRIREQLEDHAFHSMDTIDRMFFERYGDLRILRADQLLRSKSATPEQIAERLKQYLDSYKIYSSLSLFDLKRIRIADTSGRNIGEQDALTEYWKDIADGRDLVMKVAESATTKRIIIHFVAVVRDAQGRPFRVVISRMPIDSIHEIVEQVFQAREDGGISMVELLDGDGLILYSNYNKQGILKEQSRDWEYLKNLPGRNAGSVRHVDQGEEELTAFAREQGYRDFKGNGWLLVICTPVKVAFASAYAQGRQFGVLFAFIGLIVLSATFLASRAAVKPLKQLSAAAGEIGRGNLDVAVPVSSNDEIGRLARAFNAMARDLRESEKKYKDLVELLPQIVFEVDARGTITFVNRYGLEIFGYAKQDLEKGLNILDVVAPEDHARLMANTNKVLAGEKIENVEYTALRKGKSVFPFLVFAVPVKRDDKSIGMRGIAIDITERKKAETVAAEREQFLSNVLDSIKDGISILDDHLRIVRVNAALEQVFFDRMPVVGRKCYEAYHGRTRPCEPCPGIMTLQTGKPDSKIFQMKENGAEAWMELYTFPIFDSAKPRVTGVIEYARNITERKRAEEALRESEERYRSVVDNVGIGIALISPNMEILSLNRQMKEWSPSIDPTQRPICFRSFNRPPRAELCSYCPTIKTLKEGRVHEAVTETPTERGIMNLRIVATPLKDSEGNVIAAIELVEDITVRKRAEDEIQKLNEELEGKVEERTRQLLDAQEALVRKEKLATLGQIAGSVGHELRNPLGVMNNAVYYLQTVLADGDDTVREYLGIIKNEISSAERIVSDLLDAVRTKPPKPQSVSAAELIRMGLEKCRMPGNITVDIQAEPQRPVFVDPFQMKQVFVNLINNAVEAMPDGGTVRISARVSGHPSFIEISIADTGEGITPENMKKLFQPLFTTKARGIGLGLVVVKNLTEANGGRLEVESEVAKGTTFTVLLPFERMLQGEG